MADRENPEEIAEALTHMANGMNRQQSDEFINALANDHPTLLGQVAKAVATAVLRRSTRDPGWRNGMDTTKYTRCPLFVVSKVSHPQHDGRLECDTVIGAELMARQSLI